MENDDKLKKSPAVYSKTIRAGRRRTYFFDVRTTKSNDYYITLTESKKKFSDDGYDRHKIFLYKEDFNKFIEALNETVNHVKQDLLPEYDFDEFNNREYEGDDDDFDDEGRHHDSGGGGGHHSRPPRKEYKAYDRPPHVASKPAEVSENTTEQKSEETAAPKAAEENHSPTAAADDFKDDDLKW